jgi:hypothetical protein
VASYVKAYVSATAREYLNSFGLNPDEAGPKVWMHVLSIGNSPAYLSENADAVKRNWPRVPLPNTTDLLEQSAAIGERVAVLLDPNANAEGVTTGNILPLIAMVANLSLVGAGPLDPAKDLRLTKGWGHKASNGVNPGKGKIVQREYTPAELNAITQSALSSDLTVDQVFAAIGTMTCDVYLNDGTYWKNVPVKVWDYYIGGYQVIKKWLSYREAKVLGRAITVSEADHVRDIARRLTAICLMHKQLDKNYEVVKAAAYAWPVHGAGQPVPAEEVIELVSSAE